MTEERNARVTRIGKVVSDKMQKTRRSCSRTFPFSIRCTKKGVQHTIKFKAHENNEAHIGDVVEIMQTRPLSKR